MTIYEVDSYSFILQVRRTGLTDVKPKMLGVQLRE